MYSDLPEITCQMVVCGRTLTNRHLNEQPTAEDGHTEVVRELLARPETDVNLQAKECVEVGIREAERAPPAA